MTLRRTVAGMPYTMIGLSKVAGNRPCSPPDYASKVLVAGV